MKTYILFLLVLIGCSKTSVQPDITGHWVGSSTNISVDVTIIKSKTGYNGYAGSGTYSITGGCYSVGCPNTGSIDDLQVTHNVTQNVWIIVISHNTINNNGPVPLGLNPIVASSDFNTLSVQNESYIGQKIDNGPEIFELKRKQ